MECKLAIGKFRWIVQLQYAVCTTSLLKKMANQSERWKKPTDLPGSVLPKKSMCYMPQESGGNGQVILTMRKAHGIPNTPSRVSTNPKGVQIKSTEGVSYLITAASKTLCFSLHVPLHLELCPSPTPC